MTYIYYGKWGRDWLLPPLKVMLRDCQLCNSYSYEHMEQAHQGVYADESGPEMARLLSSMSEDASWPLTVRIAHTAIVPDDNGACSGPHVAN